LKLKFDHYQFNQTESNGVPVYWKNIPWANGFAYIRVIVTAGGSHDPVGKEGLAHFLEHLPFDGCTHWPTFEIIESVNRALFQGTLNAHTGFYGTVYTGKFLTENTDGVMNFLGNFISSPVLDAGEFEKERGVINQEIWDHYGNMNKELLAKKTNHILYGDHPLGRQHRTFGWHDTVEKLTVNDLKAFHENFYHRGSMKIVVVGDIAEKDLSKISLLTKQIPDGRRNEIIDKPLTWPNPLQTKHSVSASEYFGLSGASIPNETEIEIARCAPLMANDQTIFLTRSLLSKIIYSRIRGKIGGTYTPKVLVYMYPDHVFLVISLKVRPPIAEAVYEIISDTISQLASCNPSHLELFNECKSGAIRSKRSIDPSIENIADNVIEDLLCWGHINTTEHDLENIDKVTYQDVGDFVSRQLRSEQLFWSIMTP